MYIYIYIHIYRHTNIKATRQQQGSSKSTCNTKAAGLKQETIEIILQAAGLKQGQR